MRTTPASTESSLRRLLELIEDALPRAVSLRHALHAEPELGWREERTSERIAAHLAELDQHRVAGTGLLVATGRGPVVAVRAELDGLPIAERSQGLFAAANGAMHACGHDVHAAAAAAVLDAAQRLGDGLPFRALGVFQPAEECYPSGARALAELPELREATATVAVHVHPDVPWGSIALDAGAVNAACANFAITVHGRAGHAAYPQRGRDALAAAAAIVTALPGALTRDVDPLTPTVVHVGTLNAGQAENVIAESATLTGTLRTLDPSAPQRLEELLRNTVTATVAAHGCTADVDVTHGEPVLVNDAAIAGRARTTFSTLAIPLAAPWRSCGADDFAFYRAPVALAYVGLRGAPRFADRPLHHPEFLPPDAAVRACARAQAVLLFAAAAVATGASPSA